MTPTINITEKCLPADLAYRFGTFIKPFFIILIYCPTSRQGYNRFNIFMVAGVLARLIITLATSPIEGYLGRP
jgi:hypothetical protein